MPAAPRPVSRSLTTLLPACYLGRCGPRGPGTRCAPAPPSRPPPRLGRDQKGARIDAPRLQQVADQAAHVLGLLDDDAVELVHLRRIELPGSSRSARLRKQLDELDATALEMAGVARVRLENNGRFLEEGLVARVELERTQQEFNEARRFLLDIARYQHALEANEIQFTHENATRIREARAEVEVAKHLVLSGKPRGLGHGLAGPQLGLELLLGRPGLWRAKSPLSRTRRP